MQRTVWTGLGAMLLMFGVHRAGSQGIVFDTTDVQSLFAVGNTITTTIDTMTRVANIGTPGQTSWDFGGLSTTSVTRMRSVPVGSTPYATDFPQATHALRDTTFTYSFYSASLATTVTLVGTGIRYFGVEGDLLGYGLKGTGDAYIYGSPYPAQGQWLNAPASVEYDLPLQISTSWIADYTESIAGTAFVSGITFPFGPITTHHTITYTVDAYGTLNLPGGQVQEALRIRKMDRFMSGTTIGVRAGYIFLAKNGSTVTLTVIDTSATSGTVAVTDVQWSAPGSDLPVPIELAGFTAARRDGGSVTLTWTTLSETNNFGFTVQRKIPHGPEYVDVPGSFVAGHGTTVVRQEYSYVDNPGSAEVLWYRLKQVDLDGALFFSDPVQVGATTGVREIAPLSFELLQNYPNPFNPSTTISYTVPARLPVTLTLWNVYGQQVAVLHHAVQDAGRHQIRFDGSGLSSGVYFYKLQAGPYVLTKPLVFMK